MTQKQSKIQISGLWARTDKMQVKFRRKSYCSFVPLHPTFDQKGICVWFSFSSFLPCSPSPPFLPLSLQKVGGGKEVEELVEFGWLFHPRLQPFGLRPRGWLLLSVPTFFPFTQDIFPCTSHTSNPLSSLPKGGAAKAQPDTTFWKDNDQRFFITAVVSSVSNTVESSCFGSGYVSICLLFLLKVKCMLVLCTTATVSLKKYIFLCILRKYIHCPLQKCPFITKKIKIGVVITGLHSFCT